MLLKLCGSVVSLFIVALIVLWPFVWSLFCYVVLALVVLPAVLWLHVSVLCLFLMAPWLSYSLTFCIYYQLLTVCANTHRYPISQYDYIQFIKGV